MELVEPTGAELERLRSKDYAAWAWIDELPNIRNLGELMQLFYLHGKQVKLLSVSLPPTEHPQAETKKHEPE